MADREVDILYQRALERGQHGQLWSTLTRRPRCLLDLASVAYKGEVPPCCDAGLRTVPINLIRGSEGRSHDFDRDFNPLQNRTAARWLSIAAARQRGKDLPPVALIQIGDAFFVRDGHHRISVARAFGQRSVNATVEIWQRERQSPQESQSLKPIQNSDGHLTRTSCALLKQARALFSPVWPSLASKKPA